MLEDSVLSVVAITASTKVVSYLTMLCAVSCADSWISAAYLVLANSCRGGSAVGAGVQVLVVGCIVVHIERKDKPLWEDSTQGVIHLVGKYEHLLSLNKPTTVQLNQKQLLFGQVVAVLNIQLVEH